MIGGSRRAALAGAVAMLLVIAFAAGGYASGRTTRTSHAAAHAAAAAAREAAFMQSRATSLERSRTDGRTEGVAAGGVDGAVAGKRDGEKQAAAARAQQASTRGSGGCAVVVSGYCEPPGPGATGQPCPSGTVPNADGGVVCVPQGLIQQNSGGSPNAPPPAYQNPQQARNYCQQSQPQDVPPPGTQAAPGYSGPVQC